MAARSPRRSNQGKKSRKPRRKPGWALRASVCESLAAHYGDAESIVKNARVIIHFVDTDTLKGERPTLRVVPEREAVDRGQ